MQVAEPLDVPCASCPCCQLSWSILRSLQHQSQPCPPSHTGYSHSLVSLGASRLAGMGSLAWDMGLQPGGSLEQCSGEGIEGRWDQPARACRRESTEVRRGSRKKVLCPSAAFAGAGCLDGKWAGAVAGSLVQLLLEESPHRFPFFVGQWLDVLCRAVPCQWTYKCQVNCFFQP